MAIFSFHVVLTFVAASIYSKFTTRYSSRLFEKICSGLHYFLLHTSLVPLSHEKRKNSKRQKNNYIASENETLKFVQLPVVVAELENFPFFEAAIRIVNYFVITTIIYVISEVFVYFFSNHKGANVSLIWVLFSLLYQSYTLVKLAYLRINSPELSEERNLLISSAMILFLMSLAMSLFSHAIIDVSFNKVSFDHFLMTVNEFLQHNGFEDFRFYPDKGFSLTFICILSILTAIIGSAFLFPTFQYSSVYSDLVSHEDTQVLEKTLHHSIYFAPLFIFLSFTKPVASHVLETKIVSLEQYKAIQVVAVCIWTFGRFLTTKMHLQKILDRPIDRINSFKQMKEDQCRRKVTYYICYFCAAFLQYFLPVSITFLVTLMLKSLGGISLSSLWTSIEVKTTVSPEFPILAQFMSAEIQRPFWSLLLTILLGIHSLLNVISVIGKQNFVQIT